MARFGQFIGLKAGTVFRSTLPEPLIGTHDCPRHRFPHMPRHVVAGARPPPCKRRVSGSNPDSGFQEILAKPAFIGCLGRLSNWP